MPKKPRKVIESLWLSEDGGGMIDEKYFDDINELRLQEPEVKDLLKHWRSLTKMVEKSRYDCLGAYASIERGECTADIFLKVSLIHSGPNDTYLPKREISDIKKRANGFMKAMVLEGFKIEPMEPDQPDEQITEYWLTLVTLRDFVRTVDRLVMLLIEFGLFEYFWEDRGA